MTSDSNSKSRSWYVTLLVFSGLFLGMAFFGSGTPAAKIITDRFPLFMGPFLRLLAAAIVTTPVLFCCWQGFGELPWKDRIRVLVIGGVGLVAFSIFLLTGMQMVNGVVGAVVMSMSPAAAAVGASWFLGDNLGWRKILAITLAVAGVSIINVSGKSIEATGWKLVLGSLLVFGAVCSQTAYTLLAKQATKDMNPVAIVPLAAWVAVILFAIPGVWQAIQFDWTKPNWNEWFALFWWGIGPFAIGTSLWFSALQKVRASTAAGFMGAMPASALVLSYIWLGDSFHWIHLLGFALVFVSIALVSWAHRVKEKQQADSDQGQQ